MANRPKPLFWAAVAAVALALVTISLKRMAARAGGEPAAPGAEPRAAPAGTLELTLHSSSAKKDWINQMVEAFNAAGHRAAGKAIRVKAVHVESGQSLEDLKQGVAKPDLWSPGDDSWLQLAAGHWRNVKQKELFDHYEPLVNIPLVIAMWEPMARALGHPRPIGLHDLARVAANPKGWGALGHPEWGRFRWGHAHPDANSGFLAVISEVYAALGKTEGLRAEDLKNPRVVDFLRQFEGAVEHYGLSNSWIDDLMRRKGPSYLSCAVQYENTIIAGNERSQNRPFKMVAIYPREGSFWTQHPVAILKEEWVTADKQEAARAFVEFLLSPEAQRRAMQLGMRPIAKGVALAAPFDEDHGVRSDVAGEARLAVPDEAVLRRVRDLWEEVKVPATVVLALDRSASMQGAAMDNAKAGAVEFIRNMRPRDQLEVMAFNHEKSRAVPLCPVRDCGEQAVALVSGLFAEGQTALHDTVADAYQELLERSRRDPRRRYNVIVLTDGKDTSSRMSRPDFLDKLPRGEEYDVPKIYTIAYGGEADRDLLAEISNRTNARLFTSKPDEIAKTYKELSANF